MGKESGNFLKNKKAQQSNWFMIILVLAVITLVVVALAITGAFDKIGGIFDKVDDLETAVQACNGYAQGELKTSYCRKFHHVEIAGEAQYVTCEYLGDNNYLDNNMECGGVDSEDLARKYCENQGLEGENINEWVCVVEEGPQGEEGYALDNA